MSDRHSATYPIFASEEGRRRYREAYDRALAAWPILCESITAPTRFGPTHLVASGPMGAPALLLLPSLAGTATVWRANVEALSARHRVYAVDVIGQPGRSLAERRLETRRDCASWLTDVLDHLAVTSASLVGCSFGGFLALSQAAITPERVERVVMISPAGTFVGLSLEFVLTMATGRWRRRLRKLLGDKRPPTLRAISAPPGPMHAADAAWRGLMGVTLAEAPKLNVINASVLPRRELLRIRPPALLMIGELERLFPPAATLALARRRMPALETLLVPGADHIAAMAQPEFVNAAILDFLAGPPG